MQPVIGCRCYSWKVGLVSSCKCLSLQSALLAAVKHAFDSGLILDIYRPERVISWRNASHRITSASLTQSLLCSASVYCSCTRLERLMLNELREQKSCRAQELCKSRGGRPAGFPSLINPTVSVDVKQRSTQQNLLTHNP